MVEVETPNGKAVRHKWISEAAKVFQSEDGKAWLLSLLDKATDIGEEAPDAG
jgi:hypothetical protein